MPKLWGSIDLGTHTARLLVGEIEEAKPRLRPWIRKREYVHLGGGFDPSGERILQEGSMARAIEVMKDFRATLDKLRVESVFGVATGVIREAVNRDSFLARIQQQTGIRIVPIGGDEEALLTGTGALHCLGIQTDAVLVFDLGGRSTEFFLRSGAVPLTRSIPVGAVVLAQECLISDPPTRTQARELRYKTRGILKQALAGPIAEARGVQLVGTGGTVTAIAALLAGVSVITSETVSGLVIERPDLEVLIQKLLAMSLAERLAMPAMEPGRAEVIVAGALILRDIIGFCGAKRCTASMGDLLEGNLLQHVEDYRDE
jgi:exopolyphosphatase/guanosine-5'-triphosphate,3'-diphosphate pyrophosphatase